MGPRIGLDAVEKRTIKSHPTRSPSLYRLINIAKVLSYLLMLKYIIVNFKRLKTNYCICENRPTVIDKTPLCGIKYSRGGENRNYDDLTVL
jgi:hypothetical protein